MVDAPELEVAPDGRAAAVALLNRRGRTRILWSASADAAGRWSPGAVVPGPDGARLSSVALATNGPVAGWMEQRRVGGRQRVMTAWRSGAGWSRPAPLDAPSPHDLGPVQLVADGDGALAAWARWDAAPKLRRASIRARHIGPDGLEPAATVSPITLPPVGGPGIYVIYLSPPVDLRLLPGASPTLIWSGPAGPARTAGRRLMVARRDTGGAWRAEPLGGASGIAPLAGGDTTAVWLESPPNDAANRIRMATFGG